MDIQRYWRVVRKRLWLIALAVLVATGVGYWSEIAYWMIAAGVISGLLEQLPLENAVQRAAWMGARAVQVRGDTEGLPTREKLRAEGFECMA